MDDDGILNLLNLVLLYRNIPQRCKLGKEINSLLEFFIKNNVYFRKPTQKAPIDLDVWL